jgi:hypothetical protein
MPLPSTALQPSLFLERLVRFLIPYFIGDAPDAETARAEILETLQSYGARTRAEMLNAVQIIAFSFSALDLLQEAKMTEMSPSMRLRFHGCANNLNRSSQKNEQTLAKRLACDPPNAETSAEPIDDVTDAEAEETLRLVQATLAAHHASLSGTTTAQPGDIALPWGAMRDTLTKMGMPIPRRP